MDEVVIDPERRARTRCSLLQGVTFGDILRHGLLQKHMDTGTEQLLRDRFMQRRRHKDMRDIYGTVRDQRIDGTVSPGDVPSLGEGCQYLGIEINGSSKFEACHARGAQQHASRQYCRRLCIQHASLS